VGRLLFSRQYTYNLISACCRFETAPLIDQRPFMRDLQTTLHD
jgi:hypothetical protein